MLIHLSSELLVLLVFLTSIDASPTNIWVIQIDNSPAPPPELGPPASRNAIRDPAALKWSLGAIFGAYAAYLFLTLLAVVFVGNRLRRRAQTSDGTLRMEVLKTNGQVTMREVESGLAPLKSPKTPSKFSFKSWGKGHKAQDSQASFSTVDTRVVEQDRARNMDDMTKLYAAVMAHDEQKSKSSGSSPITGGNSPITPRTPRSPDYPPEFQHLRQAQNHALVHPMAPTPTNAAFIVPDLPPSRSSAMKSPVSSVFSGTTRVASTDSKRARPAPITVRGQPISRPMGSADLTQSATHPTHIPLQDRQYTPGPPPPTPGKDAPIPLAPITHLRQKGPPPPPLPLSDSSSHNSSQKSLPFRQFYSDGLKSAPATKTTFVDRRASKHTAPMTGVPSTPYTPYQPNTPLTPLTPRRLMTREEIKKNKKQYAMKVVRENDMVASDTDMWGTE